MYIVRSYSFLLILSILLFSSCNDEAKKHSLNVSVEKADEKFFKGDSSLTLSCKVLTDTSNRNPKTNCKDEAIIESFDLGDSININIYRIALDHSYNGACEMKGDLLKVYTWNDSIGCTGALWCCVIKYMIKKTDYKEIQFEYINNYAPSMKMCQDDWKPMKN